MATDYITQEPMTLDGFRGLLAAAGVPVPCNCEPEEVDCEDGSVHVRFTRYGATDVQGVVDAVPCHDEHSDEYMDLMFEPEDGEEC